MRGGYSTGRLQAECYEWQRSAPEPRHASCWSGSETYGTEPCIVMMALTTSGLTVMVTQLSI